MILEYTISIGSLIQSSLLLVAALAAYYTLKGDVHVLKRDVRYIEENQRTMAEAFSQLEKILTQVAVQDNRIDMLERRLEDFKHEKR